MRVVLIGADSPAAAKRVPAVRIEFGFAQETNSRKRKRYVSKPITLRYVVRQELIYVYDASQPSWEGACVDELKILADVAAHRVEP